MGNGCVSRCRTTATTARASSMSRHCSLSRAHTHALLAPTRHVARYCRVHAGGTPHDPRPPLPHSPAPAPPAAWLGLGGSSTSPSLRSRSHSPSRTSSSARRKHSRCLASSPSSPLASTWASASASPPLCRTPLLWRLPPAIETEPQRKQRCLPPRPSPCVFRSRRYGRTRISPEVGHFLEEFWEVLAYFGNTVVVRARKLFAVPSVNVCL